MYRRIVAISVLVAFLLAGCSQSSVQAPDEAPTASFEESPCPFSVPAGQIVTCGFVTVPQDHNDPDGPTLRLAVAVFKDQSSEHLPDPVIFLAGGPGEKTVHAAPQLAQLFGPVYANRDLVIFDQRGVGLSEPSLECPETVQVGYDLLDEPDQEIVAQASFDAILACRDRLVSEGHDLSVYNTVQNAADVEALRVALGYDQVNLYGGSYGSLLAQAVMRDHPEHIRSVVLESVLPAEKSFFVDTTLTVPQAIMRLLDLCAADQACASAYPDLEDVLFEVIDRLNEEPIAIIVVDPTDGQSYDALLSGDTVLANLRVVLYLTPTIPSVPQAIYDVYNGNYELMTQLTSLRFLFSDALSRGMMYPVMCAEDLIGRTPEEILDIRDSLPSQLVGSSNPNLSTEYGFFAVCENWPVEEADERVKEPVVSDIPTLVLAGELDPVTPPEFGQLVADYLSHSFFFTFPGAGHTGDSNSPCALSITTSFIDDPMSEPDSSCIAEMPGLAFDIPGEIAQVTMEPYSNATLGLSGVVPSGWTEVETGIFVRGSTALDPVAMQLATEPVGLEEMLGLVVQSYGLESSPENTGERQANNLTWLLYEFEIQGVLRYLGLAEDNSTTLVVILRTSADEREVLYDTVFLPVMDGLTLAE
jgi:pimeloyl-ACP methyl ester carboxylesterase